MAHAVWRILVLVFILCIGASSVVRAASDHRFDIPADAADRSLKRLGEQSGREVLYPADAIAGVRTRAVRGQMTAFEALRQMLMGTVLIGMEDPATGALTVRRQAASVDHARQSDSPFPIVATGPIVNGPGVSNETGGVAGRVRNKTTGVYLEGARVEIEGTGQVVTTERGGTFTLQNVPAGEVRLIVSYTGLDVQRVPVTIESARVVQLEIGLTSGIYEMETFVVADAREGQAAAITLQRVAPNVKSIVATDAFGNIADGNIAEFAKRLPGVAAEYAQLEAQRLTIRGMNSDLNTVTFDGMTLPSASNNTRGVSINEFPIGFIEMIEVTKSPTPDMDGDAIGGNVNLKPKTVFDRAEPRQIAFSANVNFRLNERSRTTPSASLSFSDVFGRKKNFGLLLSASTSENYQPVERTQQEWEFTLNQPAFLRQFRVDDYQDTRIRRGLGLRLDYKAGANSIVSLNAYYNRFQMEQIQRALFITQIPQVATLDATGRPIPFQTQFPFGHPSYQPGALTAAGARLRAGIMPGYADNYTHGINSTARMLNQRPLTHSDTYSLQPSGRHTLGNLRLDYSGAYSATATKAIQEPQYPGDPNSQGTEITVPGTDWIFDGRQDIIHRRMEFAGGNDLYDPTKWVMSQIVHRTAHRKIDTYAAQANAKYAVETVVPAYVQAGFKYKVLERRHTMPSRRFTFTGPGGLGQFRGDYAYGPVENRYQSPPWHDLGRINLLLHQRPEYFTEDHVYRVQQTLSQEKKAREEIAAVYLMGSMTLSRLSVLGGVRVERTDLEGTGLLRNAQAAAGIADPVERARVEFGGRNTEQRDYQHVFPGIHFRFEPAAGWVMRASYSASIGRPNMLTIVPDTTINFANQTISQNNSGLRPQTSDNFDVSIERYFEPVGQISAGVFLKELKSFFYSSQVTIPAGADNGFDGDYANWRLSTQFNGGSARVRGVEFNYQQQFSFLAGWLGGFGFYGNYTYLETVGDFGDIGRRRTEIPNFKPHVLNAGISYHRHRLSARVHASFTRPYLNTFNADPSQLFYTARLTLVDINLEYKLYRQYRLFADIQNVFNAANIEYQALPNRISRREYLGQRVSIGISGRL